MYVAALWRYPVKSLAGERLVEAELGPDGIVGDRVVHVRGSRGLLTGRTRHELLTLPASTGTDGRPLIDGLPWDGEPARAAVRARAGADADLVAYRGPERFDVTNLLVATDEAVDRLGADVRRLRPNIVIGGVPPGAEANWPGNELVVGDVVIGLYTSRARCVVTTIDPDTGAQDLEVYRRIRTDFGGKLALDAWVIRPGRIRVGDQARLRPTDAQPTDVGGWVIGAPYRLGRRAAP